MKRFSREMILVATVFQNLMRRHLTLDTPEEQLVVDALRRSNGALVDASLSDLGDYLSSLDAEALRGVASNVKGIYHELRFVQDFNATHPGQTAELFPSTNHPGSDVLIRDAQSGEILREIQLKASDNAAYALEGFDADSGIELLGTTEIANANVLIGESGYANADLTADVLEQFEQVEGLSLTAQALDGIQTSGLIAAARRGYEILQGQTPPAEGARKLGLDVAIATGTTALVALLFS